MLLCAALAGLAGLLLAPTALAEDQFFGYNGGEAPSGTICEPSQACTAYVESAPYTSPVTGWVTEFTVSHSTTGGSGQTVRLLVVKNGTTVEASSPLEPLSTSATTQTFSIPVAEQPYVERGQALQVTVVPAAGETADSVIVKGAGDVVGCASAPSTAGEAIEGCGGLGAPIYMGSTDAVRAFVEDEVRPPEAVSYAPASNVAATSAELHARIKANDPGGHATAARFEYGTVESNLNQTSPEQAVGSGEPGEEEFDQSIDGLKPNTTYYYRVSVSNYEASTNSGWEYGYQTGNSEIGSFTTPSAPAPSVALSAATNVGETTATLNGSVASNGFATRWKFEYGESLGYGASSTEGEAGSGGGATPQGASANLAGLTPNTLYHYRLVATSAGGATQSADGTFRTAAGSPPALSGFTFRDLSPWEVVLDFGVDPKGYQTTFVVQWGTSTSYGNSDSGGPTSAVFGPQGYSWDAEDDLSPGTTYHMRVLATNRWGTTTGPDLTVTTPRLTPLFLVEEFGVPSSRVPETVDIQNPIVVLGRRFTCPPACGVTVEVDAVGKHGKKIKLGTARFKVPKDKRKHKLEVKLPHRARRLLAQHHDLHVKVHYKIANDKGTSSTLVSSLTLTAKRPGHGHRRRSRG